MISDEKFAASRELMEQAYNYLRDGYEQALNALEEAETENVKLRELLSEAYEDQCDESDRWKYRDRMRELGVEVDE